MNVLASMFGVTGQSDKDLFPCFNEEYQSQRISSTFFDDFSIADRYGLNAIKDTFNRSFKNWKDDCKMLTELTVVLNHKCWMHYEKGDMDKSEFYSCLYYKARDYGYDHLKGEEVKFFYSVLD